MLGLGVFQVKGSEVKQCLGPSGSSRRTLLGSIKCFSGHQWLSHVITMLRDAQNASTSHSVVRKTLRVKEDPEGGEKTQFFCSVSAQRTATTEPCPLSACASSPSKTGYPSARFTEDLLQGAPP